MLHFTQKLVKITKTHPTFIFFHAVLAFRYQDIGQAQLNTII